jgi:hypothetical protein
MASRIRHCVECPRCLTRYLLGFSPYRNGSYLLPLAQDSFDQWTLYCSCRSPHYPSRWGGDEIKLYRVAKAAHLRGFGGPGEITSCADSGTSTLAFLSEERRPSQRQRRSDQEKTALGYFELGS